MIRDALHQSEVSLGIFASDLAHRRHRPTKILRIQRAAVYQVIVTRRGQGPQMLQARNRLGNWREWECRRALSHKLVELAREHRRHVLGKVHLHGWHDNVACHDLVGVRSPAEIDQGVAARPIRVAQLVGQHCIGIICRGYIVTHHSER